MNTNLDGFRSKLFGGTCKFATQKKAVSGAFEMRLNGLTWWPAQYVQIGQIWVKFIEVKRYCEEQKNLRWTFAKMDIKM